MIDVRVEVVKKALLIVMVVAILAIALPVGMMGGCPMCSSSETHLTLGICGALFLSLVALGVVLSDFLSGLSGAGSSGRLVRGSVFRPPRFA